MTQGYFCVRLRIFRVSVKSRQTRYLWNQRSSEIPTLCGGFFYSFCNDHSRRNSTQPCFSQPEDPPPASIVTCLQKIFADLRISPVSMLSKNNSLWEVNTLRSQSWTWKKKSKQYTLDFTTTSLFHAPVILIKSSLCFPIWPSKSSFRGARRKFSVFLSFSHKF